jgi:DNA polymerase elongation subunit (family B)
MSAEITRHGQVIRSDSVEALSSRIDFLSSEIICEEEEYISCKKEMYFLPSAPPKDWSERESSYKYSSYSYKMLLFGVLPSGRKATLCVEGIDPKVSVRTPDKYTDAKEFEAWIRNKVIGDENERKCCKIEINYEKRFMGYERDLHPYLYIYFKSIWNRKKFIEYLHNTYPEIETSWDDISYYPRVVSRENDTSLCTWLQISENKYDVNVVHDLIKTDADMPLIRVDFTNVKTYRGNVLTNKLLQKDNSIILCFDVETWSTNGSVPNCMLRNSELFVLSLVFTFPHSKKPIWAICLTTAPSKPSNELLTILCTCEKDLLLTASKVIEKMMPEFICGFNDSDYDWPWIMERVQRHKITKEFIQRVGMLKEIRLDQTGYIYREEKHKIEATLSVKGKYLFADGYLPFDSRIYLRQEYPKTGKSSLDFFLQMCKLPLKKEMTPQEMHGCFGRVKEFVLADNWREFVKLYTKRTYKNDKQNGLLTKYSNLHYDYYPTIPMSRQEKIDAGGNINVQNIVEIDDIEEDEDPNSYDFTNEEILKVYLRKLEDQTCADSELMMEDFDKSEEYHPQYHIVPDIPIGNDADIDKSIEEFGALCDRIRQIVVYCMYDAFRVHQLIQSQNAIGRKRAAGITSFVSLFDSFFRAGGCKVQNRVARECYIRKLNMTTRIMHVVKAGVKYAGAMVFNPIKGPVMPKLTIEERVKKAQLIVDDRKQHPSRYINPPCEERRQIPYFEFADLTNDIKHRINIFKEGIAEGKIPVYEADRGKVEQILIDYAAEKKVQRFERPFADFILENTGYPVATLDFSSLYPSIILNYNLSPEKLICPRLFGNSIAKCLQVMKKAVADGYRLEQLRFAYDGSEVYGWMIQHFDVVDEKIKAECKDSGLNMGVVPSILLEWKRDRKLAKVPMEAYENVELWMKHRKQEEISARQMVFACKSMMDNDLINNTQKELKKRAKVSDIIQSLSLENDLSADDIKYLENLVYPTPDELRDLLKADASDFKNVMDTPSKCLFVLVDSQQDVKMKAKSKRKINANSSTIMSIDTSVQIDLDEEIDIEDETIDETDENSGDVDMVEISKLPRNAEQIDDGDGGDGNGFAVSKDIQEEQELEEKKQQQEAIGSIKEVDYSAVDYTDKIADSNDNRLSKLICSTVNDNLQHYKVYRRNDRYQELFEADDAKYNYDIVSQRTELYDAIQTGIKLISNTTYGVIGNSKSPIHAIEIAGTITQRGQYFITEANKVITTQFGAKRYYGDTDSLFFSITPKTFADLDRMYYSGNMEKLAYVTRLFEITADMAKEMRDAINKHLCKITGTKYLEMAFEKVLYYAIFLAKKKYAGIKHEKAAKFSVRKLEDLFLRGIDAIKRGTYPLLRRIYEEILITSFQVDNLYSPIELVLNKIDEIYENRDKLEHKDFAKALMFKPMSLEDRAKGKGNKSLLKMADKLQAEGRPLVPYERISFVTLSVKKHFYDYDGHVVHSSVGERGELLEYAIENKLPLDLDHYMTSICSQLARIIIYHKQFHIDQIGDNDAEHNTIEIAEYKAAKKFLINYASRYFETNKNASNSVREIYQYSSRFVENSIGRANVDKHKRSMLNKYIYNAPLGSIDSIDQIFDSIVDEIERNVRVKYSKKSNRDDILEEITEFLHDFIKMNSSAKFKAKMSEKRQKRATEKFDEIYKLYCNYPNSDSVITEEVFESRFNNELLDIKNKLAYNNGVVSSWIRKRTQIYEFVVSALIKASGISERPSDMIAVNSNREIIDKIDVGKVNSLGKLKSNNEILEKIQKLADEKLNELLQEESYNKGMQVITSIRTEVKKICKLHHKNKVIRNFLRGLNGQEVPVISKYIVNEYRSSMLNNALDSMNLDIIDE